MDQKEEEQEQKSAPVYSETAYDDAFRTMEGRCDDLLIPFVSYMFGENYDKTAVVKRLRNERFVEHEDGSEEERTTDSFFEITYKNVTKRYHLECESKPYEGSILVRIFEYDTQIAKVNNESSPYKMRFNFPNSGLLLLRASREVPASAEIELVMPDGKTISYDVSIIKMSDFSIDDLFEKQLYMLIPFYIFNYESQLSDMNKDADAIDKFIRKYQNIYDRLGTELEHGNLSLASFGAIMRLTYKVAFKLTMKEANVQKKVGDFMGGQILDLPEFRIYDQGKAEGKAEGRLDVLISLVNDGLLQPEIAAERSNKTLEEFRSLMTSRQEQNN